MKVICIDAVLKSWEIPYHLKFKLEEGKIYTAIRTCIGYDLKGAPIPCYDLQEDWVYVYDCDRFIPLTNEDEKEDEKEEEIKEEIAAAVIR